ncbi:MAG: hypothetical protein AB7F67_03815 [Rhodospirillaceae bacterium]
MTARETYYLRAATAEAFDLFVAQAAPWLLTAKGALRLAGGDPVLRIAGGDGGDGFVLVPIGAVQDKPAQLALDRTRLAADQAADRGAGRDPKARRLDDYVAVTRAAKRNPAWHANLTVWGPRHQALAAAAFGDLKPGGAVERVFPNSPSYVLAGDDAKGRR